MAFFFAKINIDEKIAIMLTSIFSGLINILKKIFTHPLVILQLKIGKIVIELIALFFLVVRGTQVVSGNFDRFFFQLINDFESGLGELGNLFVSEEIVGFWYQFYYMIIHQAHPLLKVGLIVKALLLAIIFAVLIFELFFFNLKNKAIWLIFMPFKLFIIYMFLLSGGAFSLTLFDPDIIWEFGGLFTLQQAKIGFLQSKLVIFVVFIIAAREILMYNKNIFRGLKKKKPTGDEEEEE